LAACEAKDSCSKNLRRYPVDSSFTSSSIVASPGYEREAAFIQPLFLKHSGFIPDKTAAAGNLTEQYVLALLDL